MKWIILGVIALPWACYGTVTPVDLCGEPVDMAVASDAAMPSDLTGPLCLPPGAPCAPDDNMPPCCDGIACAPGSFCLTYDL